MKIWHVGASSSRVSVNGVNTLIYALAEEQQKIGDEVYLLLPVAPDEAALAFGRRTGVKFVVIAHSIWRYVKTIRSLLKDPPDIVHMHSVFVPYQALLAGLLRKARIPYVVTPHGGFAPQILARSYLKKAIYSFLFEKPRMRGAAGISVVAEGEEREMHSYVPDFKGGISCIPNAIDSDSLQTMPWSPPLAKSKLIFLGRFDIQHKGIDILLEVGRQLPEMELHLFGAAAPNTRSELETLRRTSPPNVHFHDPIFGSEKARIMATATLYVQASRWEAFGMSIVEAMYIGLPCAVASSLHLASVMERHDLGLVFGQEPAQAAVAIREALRDQQLLRRWSSRAQEFVRRNFHPGAVAQSFRVFYQRSITDHDLTSGRFSIANAFLK